MGRTKNEGIPSREMPFKGFEPFINGKINTHVPHHYNWCTGYPIPPMHESEKRPMNIPRLPDARINGRLIQN